MMEVGRVCVKLSGNDSGKYCVILEKLDDTYVTVAGEVSRGKCNISHLDALPFVVELGKNDSDEKIIQKLIDLNIINKAPRVRENKEKPKKEQVKKVRVKTKEKKTKKKSSKE